MLFLAVSALSIVKHFDVVEDDGLRRSTVL